MPAILSREVYANFPCVKCGYDLHGTMLGGTCPECGTKVAASVGLSNYHVDGKHLVVSDRTTLPGYCVKTGLSQQEVEGRTVVKTVSWVSPAIYFLLLLNILVLVVVYFIVRKQCRVTYFISHDARRAVVRNQMIGLGIFVLGIASFIGSLVMADSGSMSEDMAVVLAISSVVIGLAGLVMTALYQSPISIKKHRDGQFWLGGLSPAFIDRIRDDTGLY